MTSWRCLTTLGFERLMAKLARLFALMIRLYDQNLLTLASVAILIWPSAD